MKAHKPTDESRAFVERMIANGMTRAVIARVVGVTDKTLEKQYHHEFSTGAEVANEKVAASLYAKAIDPKGGMSGTVAAIFWAKTRMRWVETQRIENTGPDGEALKPAPTLVIRIPHNGRDDIEHMRRLAIANRGSVPVIEYFDPAEVEAAR